MNQHAKVIQTVMMNMLRMKQGIQAGGVLLRGDPGIGKEQPLHAKILTPDGWSTMGEMAVGTSVIAADGSVATVTGVFPQGKKQIFNVTFADGRVAQAGADHLWKVQKLRKKEWEILTTAQISHLLATTQRQVHIPLFCGNDVDEDVPISPYLLGALLGDGSLSRMNGIKFSTADEHMLDECRKHGVDFSHHSGYDYGVLSQRIPMSGLVSSRGERAGKLFTTLGVALDDLGLLGSNSYTKFIPEQYFRCSNHQKEALLAGMVDTDGEVSKTGAVSISTSSEQLAKDIQRLVWSMGGVSKISSRIPTYTHNGEKKLGAVSYRVSIRYHNPTALVTLPRKKDRIPASYQYKDARKLEIVSITEAGVEEAQCIMVDHPDHLYVTDDYIVTHNTTIVEMMSAMLGIKSIIIEVPHITEEHLINIPFLVYNPDTNTTQSMTSKEAPSAEDGGNREEYKMVLAQSNLYTQITNTKPMGDAEYLQHIKNSPLYIQEAYKQFGGTEDKIPPIIQQIRSKFDCILFLDEFYRQTSMRIRNILRSILNKRIGMHQLPSNTYVVYASNMRDAGLDEIPSNHQFQSVEFKAASAKDWFVWFVQKYESKPDVELNKEVILKFAKLLKDEHISHDDVTEEVRTSPRRWEQLMLYINGALPVESEQDARSLLTNVKNNFINYLTKKHSKLAAPVLKAVQELIELTSNMTVTDTNEEHDWRETLDHQIKMQKKLGEHKRHIPVISGEPGIGKTSEAWQVAKKNDLRLIEVDVSEIYSDDASGLPVPGGQDEFKKTGHMSIKFSAPKLYQQIMGQIKEADQQYHEFLVGKYGEEAGEAKFKEYEGRRFKYLILFDEINRVDEKTFNSLRKVILEKNFGPKGDNSGEYLKLPKEAIVIAALNPEGTGTSELTSHFRDVIDIIPAKATWSGTKKFLEGRNIKSVLTDQEIDKSFKDAGLHLIELFVDKFKTKQKDVPLEQRPFTLDIGTNVYVSPREYNDIYVQLVQTLDYAFSQLDGREPIDEVKKAADEPIMEAFEHGLLHPMTKAGIDNDDFIQDLKAWIRALPPKVYGGLLTKSAAGQGLSSVMGKWLDRSDLDKMPDDLDMVNSHNDINTSQLIDQIGHALRAKITDDKSLAKYVTGPQHPKVEFANNDIKMTGEPVPQLTNFMLAMLYTLHIHGFDNQRLIGLGKALSQNARDIIASLHRTNKISAAQAQEAQRELVGVRSDIMDFTDSLQVEYK